MADKQLVDIQDLANKMAQDVMEFRNAIASLELPKDLRELKLTSILPSTTSNLLKGVVGQLKTDAGNVKQEQGAQVETHLAAIEESIKARKQDVNLMVEQVKKTKGVGDEYVKVVEERAAEDNQHFDQRIEEIKIDRIVMPVLST
jgi:hypothetical protein